MSASDSLVKASSYIDTPVHYLVVHMIINMQIVTNKEKINKGNAVNFLARITSLDLLMERYSWLCVHAVKSLSL